MRKPRQTPESKLQAARQQITQEVFLGIMTAAEAYRANLKAEAAYTRATGQPAPDLRA